MNNKRSSKKIRRNNTIETLIVILIAGCMVFLINFTNNKLAEFAQLEQEAILINQDPNNPVYDQLASEIIEYRACCPYKMIEVYTSNFDLMMTLQFINKEIETVNLHDYSELIEILSSHQEGQTSIMTGNDKDVKQDIYFKWISGSDGQKYLIITYSYYHPVDNLWVFNFVGYLVIVLVFGLLILLRIRRYSDKINQYQSLSNDVRKSITISK